MSEIINQFNIFSDYHHTRGSSLSLLENVLEVVRVNVSINDFNFFGDGMSNRTIPEILLILIYFVFFVNFLGMTTEEILVRVMETVHQNPRIVKFKLHGLYEFLLLTKRSLLLGKNGVAFQENRFF